MLRFSREISTDILIDFDCGIQKMDEFIHGSLDTFLKNDPRYNFYVAVEDGLGVVGILVQLIHRYQKGYDQEGYIE